MGRSTSQEIGKQNAVRSRPACSLRRRPQPQGRDASPRDGEETPRDFVSTVHAYGVEQDYLETNPFNGITRWSVSETGIEPRVAYGSADLTAIFGSPKSSREADGGKERWLPLIACASGCVGVDCA